MVKFVETDPATILAEILIDYQNIIGKTLSTAQPEYLFCAALAYRISLERNRMNAVGNSQLLEFATGSMLDYLVALTGYTRLPEDYAVCTLQFTLVAGHGIATLPKGTRVSSPDGVVFATDEDYQILITDSIINVPATCQTVGTIGNDYAIGTITTIMDIQSYVSTCENTDITQGGSDIETDDALRLRAASGWLQKGTEDAYIIETKSLSSLITDVKVMSHEDDNLIPFGEVDIYPLLQGGTVPESALIQEIQDYFALPENHIINDTILVKSPIQVPFTLTIDVTKLLSTTQTSQNITDAIESALAIWGQAKIISLGNDIVKTELIPICKVTGVYDVAIIIVPPLGKTLTGDNLVILTNEFGYLESYTITIIGSANG